VFILSFNDFTLSGSKRLDCNLWHFKMPQELLPDDENASIILVMGITGAGKSYFINKAAGQELAGVGDSLKSCEFCNRFYIDGSTDICKGTEKPVVIPTMIGKEKVLLIDTPGFDDTSRSDTTILTEISRFLTFQYESGLKLKGVVFLHRITDVRMSGASVKTLNICLKICGKAALKNVILVTTMWKGVDPKVGAAREKELRDEFWKLMLNFGSTMMRYHGDEDSAVAIASQLLSKSTIVLELQRELVDESKKLSDTAAGSFVNDNIEDLKTKYEEELHSLDQLRRDLIDSDREMKRQLQQEFADEKRKLETLSLQQRQLQRYVGQEVRADMQRETQKRSKIWKLLPLLPSVLSLVGMFVGVPPGAIEIFTGWFATTGIGESFADCFSSN
jgi:hypothetical protein